MAIGRLNIGLTGVQPGGLAKIVPSSVAVGSGTGTVDSNGTVTFSGASSVSINDVFSAAFKSYKIILDHSASTALNTTIRLRVAGADNTTANYTRQFLLGNNTTVSASRITAQTSWTLNAPVNNRASAEFTIINPFESLETSVHCFNNADYTGSNILVMNAYAFQATTSFTGFSIIASTGNITGALSVYGYN